MGFGEEKKDEMEKGKLFIGFWKESQSGTLNEEEWESYRQIRFFFKKKGKKRRSTRHIKKKER